MTVSGKKNTVNAIAREMNDIEGQFTAIRKDFATLRHDYENKADELADNISGINININKEMIVIDVRLDMIERALLMSPIKRWWMTFRGRLFTNV